LIGICILMTAAIAMPWLANQKRKLAVVTSNAALRADAAESALRGYMAWDCSCRPCGEPCMGQIVGRPCGLSGPDSAHSV
jgi:type II secretory pathway pseudopilin PulG